MRLEINLVFVVLVLLLTGSTQTRGQSSALPPVLPGSHTGTSASPDRVTGDPGNEGPQGTRDPAGKDETSTETITRAEGTVRSDNVTDAAFKSHLLSTSSPAAASAHTDGAVVMKAHTGASSSPAGAHSLSSRPMAQSPTPLHHVSTTEDRKPPATDPTATFSSQPAHTVPIMSSTTQSQAKSKPTGRPPTSAPVPVGPKHREAPSELNVGDEELRGPRFHPSSRLDPLLAGLLSVFIVTTAIVFVVLFLKLRQRTNHPEFHRLQDLPMDDLMEDTPLSRYTY
ncbi:uncharacterized protein LOC133968131 [Platichthys flesus]|uniref:uncharacterized protein LOC133968131 n=1 Tax=Platichthys flesus TaxID=8260 RepID=UPI002DB58DBA|nr:uncharacterized protein LOC133968131 [Platichthys flesus]